MLKEKFAPVDGAALRSPIAQLKAYQHRAALLVHQTAAGIAKDVQSGKPYEVAWNNALVEIARASKAHCFLIIVGNFHKAVEDAKQNHAKLYPVLAKLSDLFALYNIEQDIGDFLEDGYVNMAQAALIRAEVRTLLDEIRPDCIALVDAFNNSDHELNSAIGGFNGHAYETLYEWAQNSPLNKAPVAVGYEEYIKPLVHAKL